MGTSSTSPPLVEYRQRPADGGVLAPLAEELGPPLQEEIAVDRRRWIERGYFLKTFGDDRFCTLLNALEVERLGGRQAALGRRNASSQMAFLDRQELRFDLAAARLHIGATRSEPAAAGNVGGIRHVPGQRVRAVRWDGWDIGTAARRARV